MGRARDPSANSLAVSRFLAIFDSLASASLEGLTLPELAMKLNCPKQSLVYGVRAMLGSGYLCIRSRRYRLGPAIFRLAGSVVSVSNFHNALRPLLEELSVHSNESAHLAVLDRPREVLMCVDAINPHNSLKYSPCVGSTRPLYCTSAGRVLLAFSERVWQHDYITKHSAIHIDLNRQVLSEELAFLRKQRFWIGADDRLAGLAEISAPIFGADRQLIAAIAINGPTERLSAKHDLLRKLISNVAARASALDLMEANR